MSRGREREADSVSFEHFEKEVMSFRRIDATDFHDEPMLFHTLVEPDASVLPLESEHDRIAGRGPSPS
jgi:hypothetical protein